MRIVAIEGLDKSGKYYHSELLAKRLSEEGYRIVQSRFYKNETPTGKLIQEWLTSTWEVDQTTIELIIAADKQSQQQWFEQLEEDGTDLLILNCYLLNQVSLGSAKGLYRGWFKDLHMFMRKHDLDIIIDIPPEESMKRTGIVREAGESYETNVNFLEQLRHNYIHLSPTYSAPKKQLINGMDSTENIHTQIYQLIKQELI
ncbi:MAG: thymidylate kinase [Paenibacillus sp.]|jgi:dTMP kinase|nr:thymidylate kinase [Paenibacillus sp.]